NADLRAKIDVAKQLLPLPGLMDKLGLGAHAKKNAHCPFHKPDKHPSFSVFEKNGAYYWKCHAGCGEGDQIDFLAKARGIDNREATKEFLRMAGVSKAETPAKPDGPAQVERDTRLICLADVQEKPIQFLEKPLFQCNAYQLLAGKKGEGKGT